MISLSGNNQTQHVLVNVGRSLHVLLKAEGFQETKIFYGFSIFKYVHMKTEVTIDNKLFLTHDDRFKVHV